MQIDLSGRIALVTGSTAGIGRATAVGLALAGAEVVINGRDELRTRNAADEIGEQVGAPELVRGVAADVGTDEGCRALIGEVPGVDILVNNAGVFEQRPVFEIADPEWLRVFEMNVLSGIRLARHHLPRMAQRGWGRGIFVSSESALQVPAEMVHYGVSKTAQLAVARGMAESIPASGVTVNSVLAGPTLTEGLQESLGRQAEPGQSIEEAGREFIANERPTSLLGRPASPEEVANMIVYLASEQASATNGAAVRVDGGVVRAIA